MVKSDSVHRRSHHLATQQPHIVKERGGNQSNKFSLFLTQNLRSCMLYSRACLACLTLIWDFVIVVVVVCPHSWHRAHEGRNTSLHKILFMYFLHVPILLYLYSWNGQIRPCHSINRIYITSETSLTHTYTNTHHLVISPSIWNIIKTITASIPCIFRVFPALHI